MTVIKTPILPDKQVFANIDVPKALNFKAICVFVATGFFLDQDTFWNHKVCLSPASIHELDTKGNLIKSQPWYKWHYSPKEISFSNIVENYAQLLENITKELVGDSTIILPLSGGLDSRSLAAVSSELDNKVFSYSYAFKNGYPENRIAEKVAKKCNFDFSSFIIRQGYLWNCITELAKLNKCYSEFTHPRQIAVVDKFKSTKGIFLLGHWGDVLFDKGVNNNITKHNVEEFLYKKMVKPSGVELGRKMWKHWQLEGDFEEYLRSRITTSFNKIKIDNISSKVRAFKTQQWAHRWTTTNIEIYKSVNPVALPYYDNNMCEFICSVDEEYLADRKIQIAHLKKYTKLAKITWQDQRPFNLNNYSFNRKPYNLPYKFYKKFRMEINKTLGNSYTQRNWELQFLGKSNEECLVSHLFSPEFKSFLSSEIIDDFYTKFKTKNSVQYAHAVSMLLTLSFFNRLYNK